MGLIANKLGFKVLYGSSYKRPISVVRQALTVLKNEHKLALVGDGSRGPIFKLQQGISYLAAKSKLPAIFIEFEYQKAYTFSSWDKFKFPLPFSKIFVKVHPPQKIGMNL